jgi:ACS family hexuronate transporter-like MFS transporter
MPTAYRLGWRMWIAPGVMMLCTLLSYIDRQTLAVLSPTILKDTGLSAEDYTEAMSAFSVAYMIANPLWGSLLDYIGLRVGMLIAVSIWTLASLSHAWVVGLLGFAVARTVLGIGEGAAFPGAFRTAIDSLPPAKQSRGMALSYSGASLGTIVTPLIVTPFALHFGWRPAFLITGFLGAAWLTMWWKVARPPMLAETTRATAKFGWPNLLDRRCWLVMSTFGLGGFGLGVSLNLCPLYLNRALGFSQAELGKLLWIPYLGYEAGYFFWGWVSDRYVGSDLRRAARVFGLLTFLALPSALIPQTDSRVAVLALFFWAMFIADGFIVLSLRVGSLIYSRGQAALVGGIGSGSWSAVLALALPIYGRWFDEKMYGVTFLSMSLVPALGTLLWLVLRRPIRVYGPEPEVQTSATGA